MHITELEEVFSNVFGTVTAEACIAFNTTCFVRGARHDKNYFLVELEILPNEIIVHDIVVNTEGCGLGSAIVRLICNYVRQNNLHVATKDSLPGHIGFWLKNGFVPTTDCSSTYIPESQVGNVLQQIE